MPEDQIEKILKKLEELARAVYKIEGVVESSKDADDIAELKARVTQT